MTVVHGVYSLLFIFLQLRSLLPHVGFQISELLVRRCLRSVANQLFKKEHANNVQKIRD